MIGMAEMALVGLSNLSADPFCGRYLPLPPSITHKDDNIVGTYLNNPADKLSRNTCLAVEATSSSNIS